MYLGNELMFNNLLLRRHPEGALLHTPTGAYLIRERRVVIPYVVEVYPLDRITPSFPAIKRMEEALFHSESSGFLRTVLKNAIPYYTLKVYNQLPSTLKDEALLLIQRAGRVHPEEIVREPERYSHTFLSLMREALSFTPKEDVRRFYELLLGQP